MTEPFPPEDIFAQISPDDERRLVSLPYRVGLYVSYADLSGGWEAQNAEIETLVNVLNSFVEDPLQPPFVQKILMQTLAARSLWPEWSQRTDDVPADAAHVAALMTPMFFEEELNGFKEVLLEIALTVAMSFKELKDDQNARLSHRDRRLAVSEIIVKLIRGFGAEKPLDHVNISPEEKEALLRLSSSLSFKKF